MVNNKRVITLLALVSLTLIILAGCSTGGKKREVGGTNREITIATLKGPSSMGMIRMIDSLSNATPVKDDVSFKVLILNEPMQVRKMMLDGSADLAVLPTTMAALLYNKGLDYRLVSIPVWGTLFLFGNDTTINGWKDLKGKRVNIMAKGMTPDALFRYLLGKNGLDPDKDITLDYSFPTHIDLTNAVIAGKTTLGVVSEPYVSLAIEKNPNIRAIMDLNAEWEKVQGVHIAQTALICRNALLKSDPETIKQIEAAFSHSTEWVNTHLDSAAALIVKYGILPDTAVARSSIPRSNLKYRSASEIQSEISNYLNIFYKLNPEYTGGKLPDENFYYKK